MENRKTKIGLIQMKMVKSKEKNLSKAVSMARKAAAKGAQIICLPELFSTLYFPQKENDKTAFELAESITGKTTKRLCSLARELGAVIIAPFYEKSRKNFYNTIALIDEKGKIAGKYRKMHIPHDPLFYEQNYFKKGNMGFKVFKTKFGNIAPLICFDQWFPEAARILALKGADIIFYPTAIGWIKGYNAPDDWLDAWTSIQRSHAIANSVHVAAVNRVGRESKLDFWGSSFVCGPFGKILAKASEKKEQVIVQEIDFAHNERVREGWGFFRNRRPKSYGHLKHWAEKKTKTPSELGYHFPAEWEKHGRVFLSWPHDTTTFPKLEKVERTYVQIIKALQETKSEEASLFVTGKKMRQKAGKLLANSGVDLKKIHFFEHNYADVWFRDYGPTFVVNRKNKKLAMVKWVFNSWGNKYKELLKDNNVPAFINKHMKFQWFFPGIVLEGGAIETNGKGTLITTKDCALNPNRNPRLGAEEIEQVFKDYLGVSKTIWLEKGIAGDDTDGHIDNLARFVNKNTIVCSFEENKKDVNYQNLSQNIEILKNARDVHGKKFRLVKIPVPKLFFGKKRLSASYCNFYIANKAVLVPQFNLPTDQKALKMISRLFPGRKTIGINCSDLVFGCGTLHCISQQEPKA